MSAAGDRVRRAGRWDGPGNAVTVVVSTSAVPTNPSTEHLEAALGSIARNPLLAGSRKLVVFDAVPGPSERQSFGDPKWRTFWREPETYAEYGARVQEACLAERPPFGNTGCLFMPSFSHLSGGLRTALALVTTPYVFVSQHDLELRAPEALPVEAVLEAMERCPNVRYVALNRHRNDHYNSRTWFRLRPELRPDCPDLEAGGLRLTAIQGFTDQTHLARVDHYRSVLLPRYPDRDVPENALHAAAKRAEHATYAGWLLGGPDEGPFISDRHSSRLALLRARLEREALGEPPV